VTQYADNEAEAEYMTFSLKSRLLLSSKGNWCFNFPQSSYRLRQSCFPLYRIALGYSVGFESITQQHSNTFWEAADCCVRTAWTHAYCL